MNVAKLTADKNIADYPDLVAEHCPDKTALIFGSRMTTYRELSVNSQRVANGLQAAGIGRGDRVAYLGGNSDHYCELLFGAIKAGAVIIPLNWRLAEPEIKAVLQDADPAFIVYDEEYAALVEASCSTLGLDYAGAIQTGHQYMSWRDSHTASIGTAPTGPDEPVVQLYTSGTTGKPKGVQLSNRSFLTQRRMQDAYGDFFAWEDDEVLLMVVPVFHIAGTGYILQAMGYGATCVIHERVEPEAMLADMVSHRVTRGFAPPVVLRWLVDRQKDDPKDLSKLKLLSYGSSPIAPSLLRESFQVLPNVGFIHLYGMTEMAGTAVFMAPDEHDPDKPGRLKSCGRPCAGVQMRIVDEAGHALSEGKVGEIELKSDCSMLRYWDSPEATKKALHEGWYRTGDAGRVDEDGFLYIVDRIKDMIVTGGENVYPVEVENALYEHADVAVAAVIGVPHPQWGEAVFAVIKSRPSADIDEDALTGFLRQRIAGYKIPKRIVLVDELPFNSSSKVLKSELRDTYYNAFSQ